MNELSMHTSRVVEFCRGSQLALDKARSLADNATNTDVVITKKDAITTTISNSEANTQTEQLSKIHWTTHQEQHLSNVLQRLAAVMEPELEIGCTPIPLHANFSMQNSAEVNIQTYQKINVCAGLAARQTQALACWLAVYTNNAPSLVVSTQAAHDNWCEHMEQCLQLFMPKRLSRADFVLFEHVLSKPLKSCARSLCTNHFDKSIFAVSLYDSYIYVWQHDATTHDLIELHAAYSEHGCALAMDWAAIDVLLTSHATGHILSWRLAAHMTLESELALKTAENNKNVDEICALVSLTPYDFIAGTKAGSVYHCRHSLNKAVTALQLLDVSLLQKHEFMITKLLKCMRDGNLCIISCDLSGHVIVYDLLRADDDNNKLSSLMPLPFKNAISCPLAQQLKTLYAPGNDGALECFNIENRTHSVVKGALPGTGMGQFIECSNNGCWIVTGLYGNELQIFYVEN